MTLWQEQEIPGLPTIAPPALATSPETQDPDLLNQILQHNLWDKQRGQIPETKTASAPQDPTKTEQPIVTEWQLKGILLPNSVYVKTDKKLKKFHANDQLPDGAILHNIFIDGIVLEKNAEKHNVYLFGKKP